MQEPDDKPPSETDETRLMEEGLPVDKAAIAKTRPATTGDDAADETRDAGLPTMESEDDDCHEGRGDDPLLSTGYERYVRWHRLGNGGVGSVSSAYDPNLGRHVAIKELHSHLSGKCAQRARFFREARITAQLQHPNIIPVHELGLTVDGTAYFSMKRVKGLSLQDVLDGLKEGDDPKLAADYPLSKRIDIFINICQAIAFAHSRGALHRDLKPENILLGAFGEVLVTDWGLVKVINRQQEEAPETDRTEHSGPDDDLTALDVTRDGAVSGTPLYMSPEQAMGKVSDLDERSDIYSLGTILYEMLTLEKSVKGDTLHAVIGEVLSGNIMPPRKRAPGRPIPCDLSAICMKCLKLDREDRYGSAEELLADLRRYQQDLPVSVRPYHIVEKSWKFCVRHPVAASTICGILLASLVALTIVMGVVRYRNQALLDLADSNRIEGSTLYARFFSLNRQFQTMVEAQHDKELNEEEVQMREQLDGLVNSAENNYRTAVMLYVFATRDKRNVKVNEAMAEIFSNRIRYALETGRYQTAERWLDLLERWLGPGYTEGRPETKQLIHDLERRLAGRGSLAISSNPPGAEVSMQNLDSLRQDAPGTTVALGTTPIAKFDVPKGRYLLTFALPDRPEIIYPVLVGHGEARQVTASLPRAIPPGTVYVPAGAFLAGGEQSRYQRLHQTETEAFFIAQHEVTFREYLTFWQSLPPEARSVELMGRVQFSRQARTFHDAWDADGRLTPPLRESLPVVGITREAAEAFCQWRAEHLGREVRLPTALEWEKAARGVDGRAFPWGNTFEPDFAFISENDEANRLWELHAEPGAFPHDRSIYGAMDMGGNVREWTSSRFPHGSPFYQIKGASFATTQIFAYAAYASDTPVVPTDVGFRYLIPYNQELDE